MPTNWTPLPIEDGGTGGTTPFSARRALGISEGASKDNMVSVKDSPFGATGNGVTNDAAAFQAAHDSAPEGSIIYMPRPSVAYLINTQLSITKGMHWIGDSSESEQHVSGTRIRSTAAIDVFNINPASDGTVHQFENFSILGGTNGMNFVRNGYISRKSFLKNLNFDSQTNAGLKTITGMIGCRHESLNFEGAGSYGIWAEGAEIIDSTQWSNVHIIDKTVEGFHSVGTVGKTNAVQFINPIIEHNLGRGMYLSATNVHMFNPWFEVNGSSAGAPDIYLDAVGAPGGGAFLYGGFMGAKHASQANVRVFVNADNCTYSENAVTHSTSTDIVNANDTSLRIGLFNVNGNPAISSPARADRLITTYFSELGVVGASDLAPVVNANTGVNVTRGTFGRTISKATFAKAAFTAAALTQDFTIWTTAAKTQITQVWVRVTQTFTGTAWATAVVRVGKTIGGQEYILDGTVFAGTPTYGDADAELGASINRAAAVQGGDYINGSNVTLRLTTTGGNVSAITAGALEVYIETQLLP